MLFFITYPYTKLNPKPRKRNRYYRLDITRQKLLVKTFKKKETNTTIYSVAPLKTDFKISNSVCGVNVYILIENVSNFGETETNPLLLGT